MLRERSQGEFTCSFAGVCTLIKSIPVEGRAAMTVNGWPLLELDGTGEFCAMDDDPWKIAESFNAPPEAIGHCRAASSLDFKRKRQTLHT